VLNFGQALVAAAQEAANRQRVARDGLPGLDTVQDACERYAVGLEERGGRTAREARAAFKKWLGNLGVTLLFGMRK